MAENVRGDGWERQIDSIDKTILRKTIDEVATAVMGSSLGLKKDEKDCTDRVVVQYVYPRATVRNLRADATAVPCLIPVQKIFESTPQLPVKIKPEKKYSGNTFLMIRVRMPVAICVTLLLPLIFGNLQVIRSSVGTSM